MASLLKDVGKQVKQNVKQGAVKGISKAVFGKGIVGGALGKAFEKKFSEKEDKDDRVAQALSEQISKEDQINSTLAHIESVVLNIADNIYNIAGVLNAQVTSMQESKRLQQERMSREAAAAEEAASEQTTQVASPTAAGTQDTGAGDKKGGIMGMVSGLMKSVGNIKGVLGKFGKKFAVVAGALAATGAVAYGLSDSSDTQSNTPAPSAAATAPSKDIGPTPVSTSTPEAQAPEPTKVEAPPSESPSSFMTDAIAKHGGERGKKEAPMVGNMMGAMESGDIGGFIDAAKAHQAAFPQPVKAPPAPTPAAPPPPAAASAPAADSEDAEAAKLAEYFQRPENAADNAQLDELQGRIGTIKRAIRDTKALIASSTTPEEKARHEAILKDQLEPGLEATKQQKKAILDKARKQLGIKPREGGGAPSSAAPSASSGVGAPSSAPSSGGSAPAGGGAGATPVPPSPSSGASVGAASTSVAAASELPAAKDKNISVSSNAPTTGSPAESSIPSPIADRGSLDNNITFNSSK